MKTHILQSSQHPQTTYTEMAALQENNFDVSSIKRVFVPEDTIAHPCDLTLVVEDGKKFKAHGHVLSKASPFFEKVLNTDMAESKERLVRLEMTSEFIMGSILEFIYTGSVQILAEDNAQELIAMADYLFIPDLKTLAGSVLVQKLDASNCISIYLFGEMYRCHELIFGSKKFIFENFTSVAKSEEFLNMSSRNVETFISSDEIDVSAEEDVFEIIIRWIDHDKAKRKKYFSQLFRHVRLVYVSRPGDIVTNDLVEENEDCLLRDNDNIAPRKSLETPVIVVSQGGEEKDEILCYFPRQDTWGTLLGNELPQFCGDLLSCHGKLYFIRMPEMRCYDPFADRWTSLPIQEGRRFRQMFVRNEDELYALVSDDQITCSECDLLRSRGINTPCGKKHLSTITRYKPESNLWEDVSSFDLGSRGSICIVAKGNFIYFIGGRRRRKILTDADRYDLFTMASTTNRKKKYFEYFTQYMTAHHTSLPITQY